MNWSNMNWTNKKIYSLNEKENVSEEMAESVNVLRSP
jgi:hypothetical protein